MIYPETTRLEGDEQQVVRSFKTDVSELELISRPIGTKDGGDGFVDKSPLDVPFRNSVEGRSKYSGAIRLGEVDISELDPSLSGQAVITEIKIEKQNPAQLGLVFAQWVGCGEIRINGKSLLEA